MPARFSAWASRAATRSRPAPRLEVAAHGVELHVLLGPEPPGDGLVALAPGLRLAPAAGEEVERLGDHGEHVEIGARRRSRPPTAASSPSPGRGSGRRGGRRPSRPSPPPRPARERRRREASGRGRGPPPRPGSAFSLWAGPMRAMAARRPWRGRGGHLREEERSHGVIAHLERDVGSTSQRGEPVENRRVQGSSDPCFARGGLTRVRSLSFGIVMSMEAAVRPGARVRRRPSARRAESRDQA